MREELFRLLTDVRPDVDFEKETALIDDGILDSFDIVTIVSVVEDKLGVSIDMSDIEPENFNSAEAILSLVQGSK